MRLVRFVVDLLTPLAVLMIFLAAGIAFAQDAAPAVVAAQPVWVTLLLGLGPWLIGALLALHLVLKLGAWLHADAKHRAGLAAALEDKAGGLADQLDAYLTSNGQDLKDLLDPAKRAAAEAHLAEQGKAAVAIAIKGAL